MGAVDLIANVACLVFDFAKKRDRGAHMKASYIFSANDVIANIGVSQLAPSLPGPDRLI